MQLPGYSDSIVEAIAVTTNLGVYTFYTGDVRPSLVISGIYSTIYGFAVLDCTLQNSEEHTLRCMGPALVVISDVDGLGGIDQSFKHNISIRIPDMSTISTTLPPVAGNTLGYNGGSITFGDDSISTWGGSFRDSVEIRPVDMSYFVIAHTKTTTANNMTDRASASVHFTASQSYIDPNTPNPEYGGSKT